MARALTMRAHQRRRSRSRWDRRPPSKKPARTPTGMALRSDIVADLDDFLRLQARLVLEDHLDEGRPYNRVPLRAEALADNVEGAVRRHGLAIGPVGGHGVIGVCHSDDGGSLRELIRPQAARIPLPVVTFVMRQDQ